MITDKSVITRNINQSVEKPDTAFKVERNMLIMILLSLTFYFATNCLMSLFVLILMPVANVDEMYSSSHANKFSFQTHHASVLSSAGLLFLRLLPLTTVTLESARLFSRLP